MNIHQVAHIGDISISIKGIYLYWCSNPNLTGHLCVFRRLSSVKFIGQYKSYNPMVCWGLLLQGNSICNQGRFEHRRDTTQSVEDSHIVTNTYNTYNHTLTGIILG